MAKELPAPMALVELSLCNLQPCATTSVVTFVKTIYHALTCANALVVKMTVKGKIMNLTKAMNTIPLRKTACKIYLAFACFKNHFNMIAC